MATKNKKAGGGGTAQERVAAMRAVEKRRERARWLLTFTVVAAIIAALGGGAFWAVQKDQKDQDKKNAIANEARIKAGPPWTIPADPTAAAHKLGLEVKGGMQEGNAKHEHAHLTLFINGGQVPIPQNLGINQLTGDIAELHTHDERGVLHVESFTQKPFYLDQVFKIWELPLSATQIGQFKTDATHTLKFYVDGKEVPPDPSKIELIRAREIGIVYGTAADNAKVKVPSSFKFEQGEI